MATADDLQQLLEDLKSPVCREGVAVILKLLKIRREGYRDRWEQGDCENLLNLGKAKECRDLIKILSNE